MNVCAARNEDLFWGGFQSAFSRSGTLLTAIFAAGSAPRWF